VNTAIRRALTEITLADMQCPAWTTPPSQARVMLAVAE
jgi:hypothetical protein